MLKAVLNTAALNKMLNLARVRPRQLAVVSVRAGFQAAHDVVVQKGGDTGFLAASFYVRFNDEPRNNPASFARDGDRGGAKRDMDFWRPFRTIGRRSVWVGDAPWFVFPEREEGALEYDVDFEAEFTREVLTRRLLSAEGKSFFPPKLTLVNSAPYGETLDMWGGGPNTRAMDTDKWGGWMAQAKAACAAALRAKIADAKPTAARKRLDQEAPIQP